MFFFFYLDLNDINFLMILYYDYVKLVNSYLYLYLYYYYKYNHFIYLYEEMLYVDVLLVSLTNILFYYYIYIINICL